GRSEPSGEANPQCRLAECWPATSGAAKLEETYPDPPILPAAVLARAQVRAFALACDIHPVQNLKVLIRLAGLAALIALYFAVFVYYVAATVIDVPVYDLLGWVLHFDRYWLAGDWWQ